MDKRMEEMVDKSINQLIDDATAQVAAQNLEKVGRAPDGLQPPSGDNQPVRTNDKIENQIAEWEREGTEAEAVNMTGNLILERIENARAGIHLAVKHMVNVYHEVQKSILKYEIIYKQTQAKRNRLQDLISFKVDELNELQALQPSDLMSKIRTPEEIFGDLMGSISKSVEIIDASGDSSDDSSASDTDETQSVVSSRASTSEPNVLKRKNKDSNVKEHGKSNQKKRKQSFPCPKCTTTFRTASNRSRHAQTQHGLKSFVCPGRNIGKKDKAKCNKHFFSEEGFEGHWRKSHFEEQGQPRFLLRSTDDESCRDAGSACEEPATKQQSPKKSKKPSREAKQFLY